MTKVLTIRLEAELLGKVEARALQLGLDRAKYVRSLIEEGVSDSAHSSRKFASEDLVGMYEGSGNAADNQEVRRRFSAKAEKKSSE